MKNKLLLIPLAIISLIIGVVLLFADNIPSYYVYLPALPISYFLTTLTACKFIGEYKSNEATMLIMALTLMRYCIIPILMVYGNYNSVLKINININAPDAILLMVYENIVIYFAMVYSFLKNRNIRVQTRTFKVEFNKKALWYVFLLFLFCMVCVVAMPHLLDNYKTIFDVSEEEFTHAGRVEVQAVGTFMRALSTLYSVVFNVTRIILPVYFIGYLSKKINSSFIIISLTFLFVGLEFMFITATFAESIVSALVVVLAVSKIRPDLTNKIYRLAVSFVCAIFVIYIYARYQVSANVAGGYGGNGLIEYLCGWTTAYFTGVDNVAASLNVPRENIWEYLLNSMQITIPFNTTIFGAAGDSLPTLFNASNFSRGQIPSILGNGYFYFGYLFAPLFSYLFAYYAVKFCCIANASLLYWRYIAYMFIAIVFSLGIAMYNEVIALGWINMWGLFLLLFAFFADKKIKNQTS